MVELLENDADWVGWSVQPLVEAYQVCLNIDANECWEDKCLGVCFGASHLIFLEKLSSICKKAKSRTSTRQ